LGHEVFRLIFARNVHQIDLNLSVFPPRVYFRENRLQRSESRYVRQILRTWSECNVAYAWPEWKQGE